PRGRPTAPPRILSSPLQSISLLGMAIIPGQGRVRTLYRALSDNNSLCESRRYQNLGYWDDGEETLDGAAEKLAVLVGPTAGIGPRDCVLDVGCGFAEHDILWAARFSPRRMVALNICCEQLAIASRMHDDARVSL